MEALKTPNLKSPAYYYAWSVPVFILLVIAGLFSGIVAFVALLAFVAIGQSTSQLITTGLTLLAGIAAFIGLLVLFISLIKKAKVAKLPKVEAIGTESANL